MLVFESQIQNLQGGETEMKLHFKGFRGIVVLIDQTTNAGGYVTHIFKIIIFVCEASLNNLAPIRITNCNIEAVFGLQVTKVVSLFP